MSRNLSNLYAIRDTLEQTLLNAENALSNALLQQANSPAPTIKIDDTEVDWNGWLKAQTDLIKSLSDQLKTIAELIQGARPYRVVLTHRPGN